MTQVALDLFDKVYKLNFYKASDLETFPYPFINDAQKITSTYLQNSL